ncbi:unnamed protein product [Coccothraustes coccothraustes]
MLRGARAGPAAPPCGQPGKWGCGMDGWITVLLADAGSGKRRTRRQQRLNRVLTFFPTAVYDLCNFSSLLFTAYSKTLLVNRLWRAEEQNLSSPAEKAAVKIACKTCSYSLYLEPAGSEVNYGIRHRKEFFQFIASH